MTDRDTHFQGFAKRLNEDINTLACSYTAGTFPGHETLQARIETIVARRAYDLVRHAIESIGPYDLDCLSTDECVMRVPDLPDLPAKSRQFDIPLIESKPLANGGVVEPGRYFIVGEAGPDGFTMSLQPIDIEKAMNTPVFRGPLSDLDKQIERETKQ